MPRLNSLVSGDLSKNRAAIRSASMRSPLAQASRILLHFDIDTVPTRPCADRSLWEQLQICELISSAAKQKLIAYQRALRVLIVKRCLPLS